MEHTKKMILVEPHNLERFRQNQIQNTAVDSLSKLDKEMMMVMDRKNTHDSEKWSMYYQILRKYLNIVSQNRKPLMLPVLENETFSNEKQSSDEILEMQPNMFDQILSTVPKQFKNKARLMLQKLQDADVSWNERGVVIFNGTEITNDAVRSGNQTLSLKVGKNFVKFYGASTYLVCWLPIKNA